MTSEPPLSLLESVESAIARGEFDAACLHPASRGFAARILLGDADDWSSPAEAGRSAPAPPWGNPQTALRLLYVEDDATWVEQLQRVLAGADAAWKFELLAVETLDEASRQLDRAAADCVLLGSSLPGNHGVYRVATLVPHAPGRVPIVVLSETEDRDLHLELLRAGAQDVVPKGRLEYRPLIRTIRFAAARQQYRTRALRKLRDQRPSVASAGIVVPQSERRVDPRYCLTKPILAIPLLPDKTPDVALRAEGFTVDVSASGLGFEIAGVNKLPSRQLLVGIEADDGMLYFATVETCHTHELAGRLRIGCRFAPRERDLLRHENLLPTVNHNSHVFATGLPTATLYKWVELGIFRPILVDRVLVCPKCNALPTFRNGCRACGSVRVASHQLIHHYACAYVGFVTEFERDGEMICPKCRTRKLVVGADYEFLNGPYRCLDCDWSDTELELVGQCLRCHMRFPVQKSIEEELIGYHVNRLDPLALIGSS